MFVFALVITTACAGLSSDGTATDSGILRINWGKRALYSDVAKKIGLNQARCGPESGGYPINNYGMGSGLICLSNAACTALELGIPLTVAADGKDWIWNDQIFCQNHDKKGQHGHDPLRCYFGDVFQHCPNTKLKGVWWQQPKCPHTLHDQYNVTANYIYYGQFFEYLFSKLNPEIVKLADIEARKIFGQSGSPANMITVHIRSDHVYHPQARITKSL